MFPTMVCACECLCVYYTQIWHNHAVVKIYFPIHLCGSSRERIYIFFCNIANCIRVWRIIFGLQRIFFLSNHYFAVSIFFLFDSRVLSIQWRKFFTCWVKRGNKFDLFSVHLLVAHTQFCIEFVKWENSKHATGISNTAQQ